MRAGLVGVLVLGVVCLWSAGGSAATASPAASAQAVAPVGGAPASGESSRLAGLPKEKVEQDILAAPVDGSVAEPALESGDPESVSLEVSPEAVRLGQPFNVSITLRHDPDVRYDLPKPLRWGTLTVSDSRVERAPAQTTIHLRAAVYDQLGDIVLPSLTLQARTAAGMRQIEVPGAGLRIETTSTSDELEDILPPVQVMVPSYLLLYLAGGFLSFCGLGWFGYRMRSRFVKVSPEEPAVQRGPPDVRALAALLELESKGWIEQGAWREQYFSLSEIVRGYLEEIAAIPAREMTTSELLESLQAKEVPGLEVDAFAAWLERGDIVRYANRAGAPADAAADVEETRRLIQSMSLAATAATAATAVTPAEEGAA